MEHTSADNARWRPSGNEHFTGSVWNSRMVEGEDPVTLITVQFAPGARSDWHRHPGGQVLYVLSGAGLVQNEDGSTVEISAGDVVHAAPGELHWHGARQDAPMSHLSITAGGATDWQDKVTDEQYGAAQP